MPRSRPRARTEGGLPGASATSPAISAIRQCATWARSAARSPTTIRPPTIRRRCWRSTRTIHTNKREIAADDFFTGLFETALEDGEIITAVAFEAPDKGGYAEIPQPGLALCHGRRLRRQGRRRRPGRASPVPAPTACSAGTTPSRRSRRTSRAAATRWLSVDAGDMMSDIHGTAAYRANLVKVMAKRAVAAA